MKTKIKCQVCGEQLTGRQQKFCSVKCKNQKNQSYLCQQKRGLQRKIRLVNIHGGECTRCNYKKNYAGLSFHHLNPELKKFQLDLRNCSNHSWEILLDESKKCQLLCLNCHSELHNPSYNIGVRSTNIPPWCW